MIIKSLCADGFRNLHDIDIALAPGVNVFWGDNGQGKTNILECIWMLSGVRSFRGAKERELFGFNTEKITAGLQFETRERLEEIAVDLPSVKLCKRRITVNGVPMVRLSKLFGKLQAVVFTPEDLALSGGEPAGRRAFLDLSVSQIKLSYASVLSRYNKILAQRNAFLKAANSQTNHGVHSPHADHSEHLGQADIDIWDTQLAGAGAFLSVYRNVYIKNLSHTAGQIYSELTGGRETLTLAYRSSIYKTDHITDIPDTVEGADPAFVLHRMREHLNDDRRAGTTLVGVHRDDLLIAVGGKPVREYGSQGQQRSAALAIKLAQARILSHERDEAPVILLDDVLSELDVGRRSYILRHLSGFQTLITACEDVLPGKSHSGKFHVRGGGIL